MNMPFPGMDPYLEHPALWPSVRTRLIVWLANQLGPLLRPRYVASVEDRVFIEGERQQRIPDIWVQKVRSRNGGTAVAEPEVNIPLVLEVEELEVHEHYIEILDLYHDRKVITVIEVVSPSNKAAGPGRDSYLAKQREVRASECHLVEIDLLRQGRHVLTVPEHIVREAAAYEYLVCVNRWPERKRYELYPARLRERLPVIRIPVAEPDADRPLDIQRALEQVYEDGSYMLRVSYDEPCEPPLAAEDQQWANERWAAYRAARADLFPEGR
jgi:hypothetical protein